MWALTQYSFWLNDNQIQIHLHTTSQTVELNQNKNHDHERLVGKVRHHYCRNNLDLVLSVQGTPQAFPSQLFTILSEYTVGLLYAIWDQDEAQDCDQDELERSFGRSRMGRVGWQGIQGLGVFMFPNIFPSFLLLSLSAFLLWCLICFFTAILSLSHLEWKEAVRKLCSGEITSQKVTWQES